MSRLLEQTKLNESRAGKANPVASCPALSYHTQMVATQTHNQIVSLSEPLSAGRAPAVSQSGRRKADTCDSSAISLSASVTHRTISAVLQQSPEPLLCEELPETSEEQGKVHIHNAVSARADANANIVLLFLKTHFYILTLYCTSVSDFLLIILIMPFLLSRNGFTQCISIYKQKFYLNCRT